MQRFAGLATILLAALLFVVSAARARSDDGMYAVHGIGVDATADNASDAREKAIAEGARKGLEQLLRDLTLADDAKSLPPVTEKMASSLVVDFEVEGERASATRYIAELGFRYKPEGVKALLGQVGHYVASQAPLTLVVPVYRAATGDLLWQPENPWRAAWKAASSSASLVPIVVPDGTPEDMQDVTTADLADQTRLDALAERYKAENAVVVIASAASPTGVPSAGLQLTLTGAGGSTSFHSQGGPTPGDALNKGVTTTLDELDRMWKQHVLKGSDSVVAFKAGQAPQTEAGDGTGHDVGGNQFAIHADLSGPGDWSALRAKLSQTNGIMRVQLKSLSRDQAVVVVNSAGDEEQMIQNLSHSGIVLGPAEAVPVGDSELASMVPATGPGAGLIYHITSTGTP